MSTVATALGRHALALVAQDLRARGIRQVAVPGYHCSTMVLPFELEGFHIEPVPVGRDLMFDPSALERCVTDQTRGHPDSGHWAVLHCEVFGTAPSSDLDSTFARLRRAGVTLVIDDTHRWPLPPGVNGDYIVASIRKFTGSPDGALVSGGSIGCPAGLAPGRRTDVDEEEVRAWRDGDVDRAEDLMDRELSPVGISAFSRAELDTIDLDAAMAARRRVSRSLRTGLEALGILPISPVDAHFCVAFRDRAGAAHASLLVRELARAGIDGPVWWPRLLAEPLGWPDDVVTLPVTGPPPDVILAMVRTLLQ